MGVVDGYGHRRACARAPILTVKERGSTSAALVIARLGAALSPSSSAIKPPKEFEHG
jgi:hypothetical protein